MFTKAFQNVRQSPGAMPAAAAITYRTNRAGRRGIASVLAMLFMVVFAALALGFYAQTTISAQVSSNERRTREAQVNTESGLQFTRYLLKKIDIGPDVPAHSVFEELGMQLDGMLVDTGNLGPDGVVGRDVPGVITIPEGKDKYIKLPSGHFRAVIREAADGSPIVKVKIIGRSPEGTAVRAVQQEYQYIKRYGMASRDSIMFNGEGTLDGYDSSVGPYSAATAFATAMATNSNITLTGNTVIKGDASPGVTGTLTKNSNDTITGSTAKLTTALDFPPVSAGAYATVNDNAILPAANFVGGNLTISGTVKLVAGTYYVQTFTANANSILDMTLANGPVIIYVNGNVDLKGKEIKTYQNRAANFRIYVTKANTTVKIPMDGKLYVAIMAPESAITMGGNNTIDIFGVLVGKSILLEGNTNIHADKRAIDGGYFSRKAQSYLEVTPDDLY
jgi:hypothetical protein